MILGVFYFRGKKMKNWILVLMLILATTVYAQRDTREILDAENVRSIRIDTDEVFKIEVTSSKTPGIRIKTHSEGEYYNEIVLETKILKDELVVTTRYPQILSGGYDKLSAHKVFSLEIEMEVPEGLEIAVNSNIASLITHGKFVAVSANLKEGYCQLLDFEGAAVINTYNGNILVEANSGIIDAHTRHGKLDIPEFLPRRNPLRITSIDGNILVRKN